eukprot:8044941-Heterocapsa_arctica.AAC.1
MNAVASSLGPGFPEPEPEPGLDRFPPAQLAEYFGGNPYVLGAAGTCPSVDCAGLGVGHPEATM